MLVDQAAEDLDFYYDRGRRLITLGLVAAQAGMAKLGAPSMPKEVRRIIKLFPPEMRLEAWREMTRASEMMATRAEFAALAAGFARLRDSAEPLPAVPVTAISATVTTSKMEGKIRPLVNASHGRLVAALPYGRHVLAERSGHMVPQDQPELVIDEILRLL